MLFPYSPRKPFFFYLHVAYDIMTYNHYRRCTITISGLAEIYAPQGTAREVPLCDWPWEIHKTFTYLLVSTKECPETITSSVSLVSTQRQKKAQNQSQEVRRVLEKSRQNGKENFKRSLLSSDMSGHLLCTYKLRRMLVPRTAK